MKTYYLTFMLPKENMSPRKGKDWEYKFGNHGIFPSYCWTYL